VEQRKLRKERCTAKQTHADLVKLGFEGSYERVAAFVRVYKAIEVFPVPVASVSRIRAPVAPCQSIQGGCDGVVLIVAKLPFAGVCFEVHSSSGVGNGKAISASAPVVLSIWYLLTPFEAYAKRNPNRVA